MKQNIIDELIKMIKQKNNLNTTTNNRENKKEGGLEEIKQGLNGL